MRRQRKAMSQINVVPYIDVMLVLLVIFMVTAPLITPGVIELPTVGSKLTVPSQPPLNIELNADRSITLRDQATNTSEARISREKLLARILERQGKSEQPVVISASGNARYEDVIQLLDFLQRGGVRKVGLLARSPS